MALPKTNCLTAPFARLAGDIRKTLEAEMMRWARRPVDDFNTDLHSQGHDPAPLRATWADIITGIRLTGIESTAPADTLLVLGRRNLKTAARWSRLLNDIPPPTITWNPTTRVATATRGGSVGHVYVLSSETALEPVDAITSPEYRSTDAASVPYSPYTGHKFITARVYAPDIDGELGWSAISIFKIP